MLSLIAVQLGHGSQVNVAGHTETKLNMRHVILALSKTKSKPLVSFLKRSRLSVPTVFGSIVESFHQDFVLDRSHNNSKKFPQLEIPEWKNVSLPASLLSYRSRQGSRRAVDSPFVTTGQ